MSFDWETNPLRLKYRSICNDHDYLQMAKIIDEGLASADPIERAHWLAMKSVQYAERREMPDHLNRAWDSLEAALQTAPDPNLHSFRSMLLQMALGVYANEGPVYRLQGLLRQMQPGLRQIVRAPATSFNVAVVCHQAGWLRHAHKWLQRALAANYLEKTTDLGKSNALAFGAWLSFELGRTAEGDAYLRDARRRFDECGVGRPRHYSLALAETWAALVRGRLQEARSSLQEHMINSPHRGYPLYLFQYNLLGARLALAEGSLAGYGYYRDQALSVCQEHGLTLSRQYFEVVMADTERKYGAPTRP